MSNCEDASNWLDEGVPVCNLLAGDELAADGLDDDGLAALPYNIPDRAY